VPASARRHRAGGRRYYLLRSRQQGQPPKNREGDLAEDLRRRTRPSSPPQKTTTTLMESFLAAIFGRHWRADAPTPVFRRGPGSRHRGDAESSRSATASGQSTVLWNGPHRGYGLFDRKVTGGVYLTMPQAASHLVDEPDPRAFEHRTVLRSFYPAGPLGARRSFGGAKPFRAK